MFGIEVSESSVSAYFDRIDLIRLQSDLSYFSYEEAMNLTTRQKSQRQLSGKFSLDLIARVGCIFTVSSDDHYQFVIVDVKNLLEANS
jgi:hypothetical protein